jgi:photosystem II stability/assembly factor-like uncharacterized protein
MIADPHRSPSTLARSIKGTGVVCSVAIVTALMPWLASTGSVAQEGGQWRQIGQALRRSGTPDPRNPDPYQSGRIASIAVDPRDASRWLAGAGNGGVWETRDAGRSWTPIADDAPTLSIGVVTFAPGNPDVIYVGTGEYVGTSPSSNVGVGILKSVNGGQSWALMGQSSFNRTTIRRLRVDPNDANVVVATSASGGSGRERGPSNAALALPQFGVKRSTDGGANWVRTLPGQVGALEVDSSNFSRQYAAIFNQNPNITDPEHVSNGIYRSTNGGVTWSRIDGPWGPEPSVPRQSAVGRIELAIAPSDPNMLYASIQGPLNASTDNPGLLGLYRTDNAWADQPTWIQIPTQATGSDGPCGGSCGYSHVISVDPRAADTLYAGGKLDLWRCTGCGVSPTWTATRRTHADFHELAWAGNRLIMGNDGGLFSSTDFGATWQGHNQPLTTNLLYDGALHPTDPDFVLAEGRDFRPLTYRASTGWHELPLAATGSWGHGGGVAISSSHPNTDWMGTHLYGVIQRTRDGGLTTLQVDRDIDKTTAAIAAPVRKCPANDDVFLAGTNRVWRTIDFFNSAMPTWTANSQPAEPQSILTITFVESDRDCNTYAYSTRAGVVRMTRNGGTTWTDLDPAKTLPERPVNSIAFDSNHCQSSVCRSVVLRCGDTDEAWAHFPHGQRVVVGRRPGPSSVRRISHSRTCRSTSSRSIRATPDSCMRAAITACGRASTEARAGRSSGSDKACRPRLCTTFRSTRRRIEQ